MEELKPEITRLFTAKEVRRKELAALPFPEKVRVVVRLQEMAAPLMRARGRKVRVWQVEETKEGGFSNPPASGQEYPHSFFDPSGEIERHKHRLPHWQQGAVFYYVTWRLADSLPQEKLAQWQEEKSAWLRLHPEPWDEVTERDYHRRFSRQIEDWLDAGSGSCVLRDPALAGVVAGALRYFDGQRYTLSTFVVMPNHVHVLFRLAASRRIEDILKSWKGFTARQINCHLGKTGSLWQEDYWDRMIRNEEHFAACRRYIRDNPAKARLREGEFIYYDAEKGDGHYGPLKGGLENPPSFD